MNDYCQRFQFVMDMNHDGVFSISDVWLMVKFIWLLPAKMVVGTLHEIPHLAAFFEIDCSSGESWGGGIFSLFPWFIALVIITTILENNQRR